MKAIVVRQPWASLIAHAVKTIETRPFRPTNTIKPGDQFAIVAGKAKPPVKATQYGEWWTWANRGVGPSRGWTLAGPDGGSTVMPFGAVVAVVKFGAAWPVLTATDGRPDGHWTNDGEHLIGYGSFPVDFTAELPLGDFTPGRYGWLLSDPHLLTTPVPVTGKQGVFNLPDDVEAAVRAQTERVGL